MSADSIEKIADDLMEAAKLLASFRIFTCSREKAKQPEGTDLFDQQIERLRETATRVRALPSLAELERGAEQAKALSRLAEQYRKMWENAEARYQGSVRILTGIHSLLHPRQVTTSDGRCFVFKSPVLDEQVQALSDKIRAIPDELAAIDAARAKEAKR